MALLARDLMEPNVLTVPADMPFLDVQHLLVEAGCSGAPVVDARGRVVGIISAMDLLRAADQAYDEDLDPGETEEPAILTLTARELATPDPVWVAPDAPAARIAERMRVLGIHRVLVGRAGVLQGILSTMDLLRAVRGRARAAAG